MDWGLYAESAGCFGYAGFKALRAWKAGRPLGRRICGEVLDRTETGEYKPVPNVPMLLIRGDARLETKSDHRGRFSFEDLAASEYRLEINGPGWQGSPMIADMTYDRCYETGVYAEQTPEGMTYSILRQSALRIPPVKAVAVELPDPPKLDVPPILIQNLPEPPHSVKQPIRP